MLLIQEIKIIWNKICRGAPYSKQRNNYNKAFTLPDKLFSEYFDNNIYYPIHMLDVRQSNKGFDEYNKIRLSKVDKFNIDCGYIINEENECRVNFNGKDFKLNKNEYIRIITNNRVVTYDDPYYIQCVYNIIDCVELKKDVFTEREPDEVLKKLIRLF